MLSSWRSFRRVLTAIAQTIRVVTFAGMLLASSTHAFLQLLTVLLPLALFCPYLFSRLVSHLAGFWHWYTVTLCEHLLGVRVIITGTPPASSRSVLMLMNHRTRLDWLFFFCCQARYASLSNLRICLKDSLKHIPGAGWVIQSLVFIFVRRRWETDEHVITRSIQYYIEVGLRPQILLFPEGTDFSRVSRKMSDQFALRNNQPKYRYLLHPHTKGFTLMVEKLKNNCDLTEIVDITVAYPYHICQSETELLAGNIPKEVHFHVETTPLCQTSQEQLDAWCRDLWVRKEDRLAYFDQHKHFPCVTSPPHRHNKIVVCSKLIATGFWFGHTVLSTVLILHYPTIQIYYMFSLCLYVLCAVGFSGLDALIPNLQTLHKQVVSVVKPSN